MAPKFESQVASRIEIRTFLAFFEGWGEKKVLHVYCGQCLLDTIIPQITIPVGYGGMNVA
jgi:hypothetical protein